MKYIIAYYAKRKNARKHVVSQFGRIRYFDSMDDAKKHPMCSHPLYTAVIMTAKHELVEVIKQ